MRFADPSAAGEHLGQDHSATLGTSRLYLGSQFIPALKGGGQGRYLSDQLRPLNLRWRLVLVLVLVELVYMTCGDPSALCMDVRPVVRPLFRRRGVR